MVSLKPVTGENFKDIISLSVRDDQKSFVAPNVYSLAQSKVYPEYIPLAVYNDGDPVGFVMYGVDEEDGEFWICRLMTDQKHQGKGFGFKAMKAVISVIREDKTRNKIFISFEPENEAAKKLYAKMGFVPDGRVIDGEIVYCLKY